MTSTLNRDDISQIGKESPRVFRTPVRTSSQYLPLPDELQRYAITDEERKAIAQLRERLGPLLTPRYTDVRLCRFLRARDRKVDQAEEMLRKEIKWRQEMHPEQIFVDFPNHPMFEQLSQYWPGDFHGVDRYGVPIIVERLAAIDTVSLFNSANHDLVMNFHIYCMERNDAILHKAWEKYGAPIGMVYIDDLHGLGMKHYNTSVIDTLRDISRIDDNYYPESLRKFIIINAPAAFKFFWKLAKMMLNKNTITKFEVLKGNYEKQINSVVTKENTPQFLGGTCTTCSHASTSCKFGGGKLNFL